MIDAMKEKEQPHSAEATPVGVTSARPFCFIVVVWGEQFRNYFLQYCLPSLLAPGNIPALANSRGAEFIIATTSDDWAAMHRTAIFNELQHHATPVFLELPPQPPERPNWIHSVVGHQLCCEAVFRKKAYRVFTVPDYIYANGAIARLDQLATAGAQAVMINVQPRIAEEAFFANLEAMGLSPRTDSRDTGTPLVYSSRQLVSAALRSFHSMTVVNEWEAPYFCGYAATPWWRVDEDGIIICGMGWNPLLIDYAAVSEHDVSLIETRGLDGDYDMRTIGHLKTIYAVRDSDEIYAASWSSLAYMAQPLRRQRLGEWGKGTAFRASYYAPHFNWLHRALLFVPVRLHAGELGKKWEETEQKAFRTLLRWLDPPPELRDLGRDLPSADREYEVLEAKIAECNLPEWRKSDTARRRKRNFMLLSAAVLLHPIFFSFPNSPRMRWLISAVQAGGRQVLPALRGDKDARTWWFSRLQNVKTRSLRRLGTRDQKADRRRGLG
jgi:hypothetical protein